MSYLTILHIKINPKKARVVHDLKHAENRFTMDIFIFCEHFQCKFSMYVRWIVSILVSNKPQVSTLSMYHLK